METYYFILHTNKREGERKKKIRLFLFAAVVKLLVE